MPINTQQDDFGRELSEVEESDRLALFTLFLSHVKHKEIQEYVSLATQYLEKNLETFPDDLRGTLLLLYALICQDEGQDDIGYAYMVEAANMGNRIALFFVGNSFLYGEYGNDIDCFQAFENYKKSCLGGLKAGCQNMLVMLKDLSHLEPETCKNNIFDLDFEKEIAYFGEMCKGDDYYACLAVYNIYKNRHSKKEASLYLVDNIGITHIVKSHLRAIYESIKNIFSKDVYDRLLVKHLISQSNHEIYGEKDIHTLESIQDEFMQFNLCIKENNHDEAYTWLEKIIEIVEDSKWKSNFQYMYASHKIDDGNIADGKKYLEESARAGNTCANWVLGDLYEFGDYGIDKNPIKAIEYYTEACFGGEEKACTRIHQVIRKIKMNEFDGFRLDDLRTYLDGTLGKYRDACSDGKSGSCVVLHGLLKSAYNKKYAIAWTRENIGYEKITIGHL